MSSPLPELRQRWVQSGDPADEAAWLAERVATGALRAERLQLAAYVGHPAALVVVRQAGPLYRRRASKAGASYQLRQWILGLGDLCPPSERVVVARRTLAVLLHSLGHDHGKAALDELTADHPPWGVFRIVAGWGQDALSEFGDSTRLRHRVTVALVGWALAEGQTPRPHAPHEWFRIGERVTHPRHGEGFVRRSGRRAFEVEFRQGARRLPHRRTEAP
ncbi:MAG: hypothetical protein JKY65_29425 [Planctomycetes bacterium]|nr:hypothetical protein [Planctomycetota bacterium]